MLLLIVLLLIFTVCFAAYKVSGKEKAVEGALIYIALLSASAIFATLTSQGDVAFELLMGILIVLLGVLLTMRFSITNIGRVVITMYKSAKDESLSKM